jgi:hypothetical protein
VKNATAIKNMFNQLAQFKLQVMDCAAKADRSMLLEGRIVALEQKQLVDRDSANTRHESMKDLMGKHKEATDARVNMAIQYNERIHQIGKSVEKQRADMDAFEARMLRDMTGINETATTCKTVCTTLGRKLDNFESETHSGMTEKSNAIQGLSDMFEELKGEVERASTQRDLEIDLRLRTKDFKYNFEILNDLLETKFAQVEETQQAVRSVLVYQKYFYPIQL